MSMESLYQEVILEHYKHPCGHGLLAQPAGSSYQVNPACGDEVTVQVSLQSGTLLQVGYEASGCSVSQASASVMYELLEGYDVSTSDSAYLAFLELMHGRGTVEADEILGDASAFTGVARYPGRIKCALLPWMALKDAKIKAGIGSGEANADVDNYARAIYQS